MPQHCSVGKCEQHMRSHILPHYVLPTLRRWSHIQSGTSTFWTVGAHRDGRLGTPSGETPTTEEQMVRLDLNGIGLHSLRGHQWETVGPPTASEHAAACVPSAAWQPRCF